MLYTDPGTGSLVLQIAFAALATGMLFIKRWWAALVACVRRGITHLRRTR
jgi:hypothetical protein